MIICHCNVLSDKQIEKACKECRGADGVGLVTPGKVFSRHGKRPNCGNCMASITRIIEEHLETSTQPAQSRRQTRIIQSPGNDAGISLKTSRQSEKLGVDKQVKSL